MIAQLDPLYIKTRPHKAVVRLLSHFLFQGRFLTTGHRWLNRLILTELALFKRLPVLKTVKKPIFIVGTGRSGSTILGKVLSMHREIGFLNEPKAMWYSIEPLEDVNGHFNRGPASYRLDAADASEQQEREARRLFASYLLVTGSRRLLDKNPELIFRTGFVRRLFPDARFLFLVRNGSDTVRSIVAWSQRARLERNGTSEDWWGIDRRKWHFIVEQLVPAEPLLAPLCAEIRALECEETMGAVEWIVTMQQGLRVMNAMPEAVSMVRYEDLTARPQQTLGALLAFCDLPQDDVFLSYAADALEVNDAKQALSLPPAFLRPFQETMAALGYDPAL